MDRPLRVVYRYTMGNAFRQASKEAQEENMRVTFQIGQKWKDDPKLTVVEPEESMVDEWQTLMRGSIKDMISGIDSQFTDAIKASK